MSGIQNAFAFMRSASSGVGYKYIIQDSAATIFGGSGTQLQNSNGTGNTSIGTGNSATLINEYGRIGAVVYKNLVMTAYRWSFNSGSSWTNYWPSNNTNSLYATVGFNGSVAMNPNSTTAVAASAYVMYDPKTGSYTNYLVCAASNGNTTSGQRYGNWLLSGIMYVPALNYFINGFCLQAEIITANASGTSFTNTNTVPQPISKYSSMYLSNDEKTMYRASIGSGNEVYKETSLYSWSYFGSVSGIPLTSGFAKVVYSKYHNTYFMLQGFAGTTQLDLYTSSDSLSWSYLRSANIFASSQYKKCDLFIDQQTGGMTVNALGYYSGKTSFWTWFNCYSSDGGVTFYLNSNLSDYAGQSKNLSYV